ncbi:hypothetical protein BJ742DRAFT_568511 [Cladochytrium replicatum]|nr:hypothetical protein BJ742DRAFT_568511 [Cladochytrium replicatum]
MIAVDDLTVVVFSKIKELNNARGIGWFKSSTSTSVNHLEQCYRASMTPHVEYIIVMGDRARMNTELSDGTSYLRLASDSWFSLDVFITSYDRQLRDVMFHPSGGWVIKSFDNGIEVSQMIGFQKAIVNMTGTEAIACNYPDGDHDHDHCNSAPHHKQCDHINHYWRDHNCCCNSDSNADTVTISTTTLATSVQGSSTVTVPTVTTVTLNMTPTGTASTSTLIQTTSFTPTTTVFITITATPNTSVVTSTTTGVTTTVAVTITPTATTTVIPTTTLSTTVIGTSTLTVPTISSWII